MGPTSPGRSRPPRSRPLRERLAGTPRLVLAIVLLAAGVLVALTATAPPAAGPVVVATRPVAAGAVLTADELTVAHRALADRPDGALTSLPPALGQRAVAVLAPGEVVTASRLAPRGLAAGLAPGRAVATVAVAAARAAVVAAGDAVRLVVAPQALTGADLLSGDAAGAAGTDAAPVTLSDDARVLAVWPGAGPDDPAIVVVDVDVGSASRLAVLPGDLLVGIVTVTA